jgi:hypothetical protein
MTRVFVAGSRSVSKLNSEIKERLNNIIEQNFEVLIGDANGTDKAVQKYLADRRYRNVVVYCMDVCRNNVGDWPTRHHTADPHSKRDRHYYGIKDTAMANDASCGFMLWDGESKGTLTNVINLLNAHKKSLLYLSGKKRFLKLSDFDDLRTALDARDIQHVSDICTSLGVKDPRAQALSAFASGAIITR